MLRHLGGAHRLQKDALFPMQEQPHQGVIFHDTLYDENAGAHVAWGQAFPFCLPEGAAPDLLNSACTRTSSSADRGCRSPA